jgi:hypothetical protein
MARAVEILAQIAEKQLKAAHGPPPLDVPIVLFNEHIMFVLGKTQRSAVVAELGPGYGFPAKGWETYALHEGTTRCLLSALYHDDVLVGVDYYVAPANRVPELRVRNFGEFRLVPGQVMIGGDVLRLDDRFVPVAEGPDDRPYSDAFEVRFPGGAAYVQGTGGTVQRLVLFAVSTAV